MSAQTLKLAGDILSGFRLLDQAENWHQAFEIFLNYFRCMRKTCVNNLSGKKALRQHILCKNGFILEGI